MSNIGADAPRESHKVFLGMDVLALESVAFYIITRYSYVVLWIIVSAARVSDLVCLAATHRSNIVQVCGTNTVGGMAYRMTRTTARGVFGCIFTAICG